VDFNSIVIRAVGIMAIVTLVTTAASWIVWRGEFERETRANKKADAEDKIRGIEQQICMLGEPQDIAYCMLTFSRYEGLRERADYNE